MFVSKDNWKKFIKTFANLFLAIRTDDGVGV